MKKIILNTIALVLCVGNLFGQFFNDGAQVIIQQGALLHIQGDFTNQGGEVTNEGLIEIGGNWENTVMGFPLTPGGGGTVQFVGSMQTIGGDFPTLFNDIQFQGNQTVTLSSNIGIGNSIDLNNGIIDLNEKVLHILNPQANAITVAGGGVRAESSDNYGFVRWDIGVQSGQSYEVPFVNNAEAAIPLHFEVTQAGQDSAGYILFSTYASAEDNTPLPVGITNVDVNGDGSGTTLVDRFWVVNAVDYSVAPFGTLGMSYDSAN